MSDQDKNPTTRSYHELAAAYDEAAENIERIRDAIEAAENDPDTTPEERGKLTVEFAGAVEQAERLKTELESSQARARAVERYKALKGDGNYRGIQVKEPDIYTEGNGLSFFTDMYWAKNGDVTARERVDRHQRH